MKTKKLIQISIPQPGGAPLVLCFSDFSTFFKYVEVNNLSTYLVSTVELYDDDK